MIKLEGGRSSLPPVLPVYFLIRRKGNKSMQLKDMLAKVVMFVASCSGGMAAGRVMSLASAQPKS